MTYLQQQRNPFQSMPSLAAVVLLHIALVYALVYGLRTTSTPLPMPPLKTHIIEPTITPPPPPTLPNQPVLATPRILTLPLPEIILPAPPTSPHALAVPRGPQTTEPTPQPPAAAPAEHKFQPAGIIAGDPSPAYPAAYQDTNRSGSVTVDCTIETTGVPTNCRATAASGGPAFATETLRWLTGPTHPVYRPAVRDGQPRREEHQWTITFQAAE